MWQSNDNSQGFDWLASLHSIHKRACGEEGGGKLTTQEEAVNSGCLFFSHNAIAAAMAPQGLCEDVYRLGVVACALVHVRQNAHGADAGAARTVQRKAFVEGVQGFVHMTNLHHHHTMW